MKSVFGKNIILSIFGESHEEYLGLTIHGLKAGLKIDEDFINQELLRRRPSMACETKRVENDNYKIISGLFNGFTTGAPLTILVKNNNVNSNDYNIGDIRPGQSDYPAFVRSHGYNDYRGGGHFSGRLTVLIVIAGAIFKQILLTKNITISSEIASIGGKTNKDEIDELLTKLQNNGDTCGFSLKVCVKGLEAGIGEPFFDSIESILSHLLFSIPSVKGVSFGDSDLHNKLGSEVIDELHYENNEVMIRNNHNGGINGGLSNGNDIICNVTFKPISTLFQSIDTINVVDKVNKNITFNGRHDSMIAYRSGVIAESMIAIGLIDLLASFYGSEWM